jgi:zinc protease
LFFCQTGWAENVDLDKSVRYGKLDNGLTYYIKHNELPRNQAEFYIVQKVGSILEDENQRGLAHFLEHMAFNGTKNFPGKNLISYLEQNGVKFGTDLNAYTSLDKTVYSISNVPARKELVDSCILILHDWSGYISLEDDEIDAERKVIHEEWRTRNSATSRMQEQLLPKLFPDGNRYSCRLPIGLMDVVDNFEHKALRDYYKKWYRPDLQGIVIVGNVDVDHVEQYIKQCWKDLPLRDNRAERFYVEVPDNEAPIVAIAHDSEAQKNSIKISYKTNITPTDERSTTEYMRDNYVTALAVSLLDSRLKEFSQNNALSLIAPRASYGEYSVAKTKLAFTVQANFNKTEWKSTLNNLVAEMKRAIEFGFSDDELTKLKTTMIRSINSSLQVKDEVPNSQYVNRYMEHFLDNEATPTIEQECNIYKQFLSDITLDEVNERMRSLIGNRNMVITMQGGDNSSLAQLTENEVLSAYAKAWEAEVSKREETHVDKQLMSQLPQPGKIVKKSYDKKLGTTNLTLSNGAKVILRHSDAKKSEIMLKAYSPGGNSLFDDSEYDNFSVINTLVPMGGLGDHSGVELGKMLDGHPVSYDARVGIIDETLTGSCVPGDEETLLQLVHLRFTTVRQDSVQFKAWKERAKMSIAARNKNAMNQFGDSLPSIMYEPSPRIAKPSIEHIENVDYKRVCNMFLERFANAADFTFVVVGNYNEETLYPLLEQYIASLPSTKGKHEKYRDVSPVMKPGKHTLHMPIAMTTPKTTIAYQVKAKYKYTPKAYLAANILQQVLEMMYTEQIREQDGGTYGVGVRVSLTRYPKDALSLSINFDTNEQQAQSLIEKAIACVESIADNGPDKAMVSKAKEFMTKSYNTYRDTNSYIMSSIMESVQYGTTNSLNYLSTLNEVTYSDIIKIAKAITTSSNVIDGRIIGYSN